MLTFFKYAITSLLLFTSIANAGLINTTSNNVISESVVSDNGWASENTFDADAIDFFVFDITERSKLTVDIAGDISFGISLYAGAITNIDNIIFNNDADFSSFFEDLSFIAGIDPFVPGFGNSPFVSDSIAAGAYTLAVGGNDAGIDLFSSFAYVIDITNEAVPNINVNAPSWLFAFGALVFLLIMLRNQTEQ